MNNIIKKIQKPDFISNNYDEYVKWKEKKKEEENQDEANKLNN